MNTKIEKYIIESTCSKTLQKALKKFNNFSETDYACLAYNAEYYDLRLELANLVKNNTTDDLLKLSLSDFIQKEETKLAGIIRYDENCLYEVKIKLSTNPYQESYLAKTYDGALNKVKYFCEYYEETLTKKARITICKRAVNDNNSVEDFNEDVLGEAIYNGEMRLLDLWYENISNEKFSEDSNGEFAIDMDNHVINWPIFLKNWDLIKYDDYDGETVFAVVIMFLNNWSENHAYCETLDVFKIMNFNKMTAEEFREELSFPLHDHIYFPKIDTVKLKDAPLDIQKAYQKFRKLYQKYLV